MYPHNGGEVPRGAGGGLRPAAQRAQPVYLASSAAAQHLRRHVRRLGLTRQTRDMQREREARKRREQRAKPSPAQPFLPYLDYLDGVLGQHDSARSKQNPAVSSARGRVRSDAGAGDGAASELSRPLTAAVGSPG